jgi:hypothetical protein
MKAVVRRLAVVAFVIFVLMAATGAAVAFGGSARRPPFPYEWVLTASGRMGTVVPSTAVWVKSRHRVAVTVTSGAMIRSNQPVYVIVLTGHFTDRRASVPAGQPFPTGTVASFVIDAHTFRILDSGLGDHLPKLGTLGAVHNLLPFLRALTRTRGHRHR